MRCISPRSRRTPSDLNFIFSKVEDALLPMEVFYGTILGKHQAVEKIPVTDVIVITQALLSDAKNKMEAAILGSTEDGHERV